MDAKTILRALAKAVPWVFSGVGVWVIGLLWVRYHPAAETTEGHTPLTHTAVFPSVPPSVPPLVYSPITAQEIIDAVNSARPLQRQAVAAGYVGTPVAWKTTFASGSLTDKGKAFIILRSGPTSKAVFIGCTISLAKYDFLRTLDVEAPLLVRGRIDSIDQSSIQFTDPELELLPSQLQTQGDNTKLDASVQAERTALKP